MCDEVKQDIVEAVCQALGCNEAEFLAIMGDVYDLRREAESFMQ